MSSIFNLPISHWIGAAIIATPRELDYINDSYIGNIISYYVKESDNPDKYIWVFEIKTSDNKRFLLEEDLIRLP